MRKHLAILLCLVLALSVLTACGGKSEPAAEEAPAASVTEAAPAPEAAAPAGDASGEMGEASGEASGEAPEMKKEPADPKGYSADFAGYQQYVLAAIEVLEAESGFDLSSFKELVTAAADENADVFANMQGQNTIVSYADFVAANG